MCKGFHLSVIAKVIPFCRSAIVIHKGNTLFIKPASCLLVRADLISNRLANAKRNAAVVARRLLATMSLEVTEAFSNGMAADVAVYFNELQDLGQVVPPAGSRESGFLKNCHSQEQRG